MARPRQITDEQILETTRACVLEKGALVSMETIAGKLGVTGPALIKRFGSRQELWLKALMPPEHPAFIESFARGPDDRPFAVQLEERFTEIFDFVEQVVPCMSALRESGIPHDKVVRGKSPLRALQSISRWLELAHERGLAQVEAPESVATAILGAIQTRSFTAHIAKVSYSARSNQQYLSDLVTLFTRALDRRPPARRARISQDT